MFERVELAPGVRLHLSPTRKFKTVTLRVFLRTDLAPVVATEVAALPFVLRRGTERVPTLRGLSRELETLFGASLEPHLEKVGEQQVLSFSLRVLGERFLPEGRSVLQPGLELLRDLILHPARDAQGHLRADEVAQEKVKIQRRLEGLINDKGAYAAERLIERMCRGEPYAVFEYGALADLPGLTGASLEARRRALVEQAPVDIYAVGAFDPQAMRAAVEEAFALPGRTPSLRGTTPHPPPRPPEEVVERLPALNQSKLVLGLRTDTTVASPGFWDLLVAVGILGGFPHSKLFRNVREAEGLCYYASASLEQFKGLVLISAGIDVANAERTRETCLAQVEAMRRGEISDDELEHTRAAFCQAYRGVLDNPGGLVNYDYLMQTHGASGRPEDAIAAIAGVTRDAAQAVAAGLRLDTGYLLAPAGGVEAADPEGEPAGD
ncbi:MAG: M16 family metallopeptidase [Planctomycetota bacterium]